MFFRRRRREEWPPGRCHCELRKKKANVLDKQCVPEGFCWFCHVCGRPGHVLHFPGAVPATLAWCRKHYLRAMILHPMGSIGIYVWGGVAVAVIGLIAVTWLL